MRKIILLALAMTALPAWANSVTYIDAKAFADRDEASVPKERAQALLHTQGEAIGRAMSVCAQAVSSEDIPPFVVVVKLDASGRVGETWRKGDSSLAVCFEKAMSTQTLFTPPHAPFYTSFEMDLHHETGM